MILHLVVMDVAFLKRTVLTFANFTNASLVGADLTNANLTSVTWSNTTCPSGVNSDDAGGACAL